MRFALGQHQSQQSPPNLRTRASGHVLYVIKDNTFYQSYKRTHSIHKNLTPTASGHFLYLIQDNIFYKSYKRTHSIQKNLRRSHRMRHFAPPPDFGMLLTFSSSPVAQLSSLLKSVCVCSCVCVCVCVYVCIIRHVACGREAFASDLVKRDLLWRQKRPIIETKETCGREAFASDLVH